VERIEKSAKLENSACFSLVAIETQRTAVHFTKPNMYCGLYYLLSILILNNLKYSFHWNNNRKTRVSFVNAFINNVIIKVFALIFRDGNLILFCFYNVVAN